MTVISSNVINGTQNMLNKLGKFDQNCECYSQFSVSEVYIIVNFLKYDKWYHEHTKGGGQKKSCNIVTT